MALGVVGREVCGGHAGRQGSTPRWPPHLLLAVVGARCGTAAVYNAAQVQHCRAWARLSATCCAGAGCCILAHPSLTPWSCWHIWAVKETGALVGKTGGAHATFRPPVVHRPAPPPPATNPLPPSPRLPHTLPALRFPAHPGPSSSTPTTTTWFRSWAPTCAPSPTWRPPWTAWQGGRRRWGATRRCPSSLVS